MDPRLSGAVSRGRARTPAAPGLMRCPRGLGGQERTVLVSTTARCCPGPVRALRLWVFRSQEHCRATALFCLA